MGAAISFKPATRESVQMLIGLAGASGSGKTWSAMLIAKGLSGGKRFAVCDTERGRSKHYADFFEFDVFEMDPPFNPSRYTEVIEAADAAGYPVIVVDSASHSWAGDGGCLDMQEAELQRMAGDDYRKREACRLASWIKPKMQMKHMVSKLLQVRAHVILCFRAEPKIDMIKEDGKVKIVPKQTLTGLDGWVPIVEKNLPFEMTLSLMLTPDAPGMPKPVKLQAQHRSAVPLNHPITEQTGAALAEWARGGSAPAETSKRTVKQGADITIFKAGGDVHCDDIEDYKARMGNALDKCPADRLKDFAKRNRENIETLAKLYPDLSKLRDRVLNECE